jgi:aminomethyltransferase
MTDPRSTPLRDRHEAAGAAFTDFGGWLMPVRYGSDLAEHRAVRKAAGLFDISHMAEFLVTGAHAGAFLDYALAARHSTMRLGKAKYSLVLASDGGIVDDVIVYRLADDRFVVIANAGNHDAVAEALAGARASFTPPAPVVSAEGAFSYIPGVHVTIEDVSEDSALLALQGPAAIAVLEALPALKLAEPARRRGEAALAWTFDELGYYSVRAADFAGESVLILRTGYTGEDGVELLVRASAAGELWDALLTVGEPFGLVPAGLAARDTLRLEAGMPLYGHELNRDVRPAQAGLGRVVATDKEVFIGKGATEPASHARVLVALVSEGKRAGRAGYAVLDAEGDTVGEITSGALSPTLGHPIALAYVDPDRSPIGTDLFIDVRGTRIPATVTEPPFYRRKK